MSSPSSIKFYAENNKLVAASYVNFGWFPTVISVWSAIHDSILELNKQKENSNFYFKTENWMEIFLYANVNEIHIPKEVIISIMYQDKKIGISLLIKCNSNW